MSLDAPSYARCKASPHSADPASIVLVFTNSSSYATRLLGTRLNRPVSSWHTNCSFNAGMFVHRFGHFSNPTHRGSRFAHQNKDVAIPVHDRRADRPPHHMFTLCGVLRGDPSLNRALLSPKDSLCDTRSPILAVLKAGTEPNARQHQEINPRANDANLL